MSLTDQVSLANIFCPLVRKPSNLMNFPVRSVTALFADHLGWRDTQKAVKQVPSLRVTVKVALLSQL